jgi:hypothetical protein
MNMINIKPMATSIGPYYYVIPPASSVLINVTFNPNAGLTNTLKIEDDSQTPLQKYTSPNGGSFQVDNSGSGYKTIILLGQHIVSAKETKLDYFHIVSSSPGSTIVQWEDIGTSPWDIEAAIILIQSDHK